MKHIRSGYVWILAALWLLCAILPAAFAEDTLDVVESIEGPLDEVQVDTGDLELPPEAGLTELDPSLVIPVESLTWSEDSVLDNGQAGDILANDDDFLISETGVLTMYKGKGGAVTIPDTVTAIGDSAFRDCNTLTSVFIPGNVETIGSSAFRGCENLSSVHLDEGVKTIGSSAFMGCSSLKDVTMENGLETVKDYAFFDCPIEELNFPDTVTELDACSINDPYSDSVLRESLKKVHWPAGVSEIPAGQFRNFNVLQSLELPGGVHFIGDSAFSGCLELVDVVLPDTLKTIDESAFRDCDSLSSISVPGSVSKIGDSAFEDCDKLSNVALLKGVETIGSSAFKGCNSLRTLSMKDGLKTVMSGAFIDCPIEELSFPDSVTTLDSSAIQDTNYEETLLTKSLKKVHWPAGVKKVYNYQFSGFAALEDIELPSGITAIGSSAFNGCTRLKKTAIPNTVTSIDDSAFCNCDSLNIIKVPGSVKSIGSNAFFDCDTLQSVSLEAGVEYIGESAFKECDSLKKLTMGKGLKTIKSSAFRFSPIEELDFPDTVTELAADAIQESDFGSTRLAKSLKKVHWPAGVTSVFSNQFRNFSTLEDAEIPTGVTSIGDSAFFNCKKLVNVSISSSVTEIADNSFNNCPKVEIMTPEGSTAETYAESSDIPVVHTDEKGHELKPKSVKLRQSKETLVVGGTLKLTATVKPAKLKARLIWKSSNKKVATVTNRGVVKALKKGTTVITVKTVNGKKATCRITVPAAPTGVELNKAKAILAVGKKLTLKAKLKGAGAKTILTWKSSNRKVATVSEKGVVKALKKGTTVITVRTANGKKATCRITVK